MKVDVTFLWIPGHAGIPGNEIVDKLARSVACEEHLPITDTTFSVREARSLISDTCLKTWQVEYDASETGLH